MPNLSPTEASDAAAQARRLALALDAIEACLGTLKPGAAPSAIADALAAPVHAFDALARDVFTKAGP